MRYIILAVLLAMPCMVSFAGTESCTTFGRKLVCLGDNEAKVRDRAGKPDRTRQLVNEHGAGVGEQWVYYMNTRPKKVITIDIQRSVVTYISERR